MSIEPELIVPYSVWHNIHGPSNQWLCYIEKGISTKKEIYQKIGVGWKKYTTFYAFSPNFIPVPLRSKIISISLRNYFPYNIANISIDLDPFYNDVPLTGTRTLQFLTYIEGVQNCRVLYFHTVRSGIFASYDVKPPVINTPHIIKRPLLCFVMPSLPTGFECIDGSCQPSNTVKNSVIECIYHCKENIHSDNNTRVKEQNPFESNPLGNLTLADLSIENSTDKSSYVLYGIILIIIVVFLVYLYKRHNFGVNEYRIYRPLSDWEKPIDQRNLKEI